MVTEVLACLAPVSGSLIVDATLGLGGHGAAILDRSAPGGKLIGFEWDQQAADLAAERLRGYGDRVRIIRSSYADLAGELDRRNIQAVDGILADLGVSSLQLDQGERGFSFRTDAPLDMRMNRDLSTTAADIIARGEEAELADILFHYGEERQARRIARHLVRAREKAPIRTTGQLARLVEEAIPLRFHPRRIHPATRTFQGLRIAVNRELDNLVRLLREAPEKLRPGGRFCLITFHSLEDRIVKHHFKEDARLRPDPTGPLEPAREEIRRNPRARSARLRCACKREAEAEK